MVRNEFRKLGRWETGDGSIPLSSSTLTKEYMSHIRIKLTDKVVDGAALQEITLPFFRAPGGVHMPFTDEALQDLAARLSEVPGIKVLVEND